MSAQPQGITKVKLSRPSYLPGATAAPPMRQRARTRLTAGEWVGMGLPDRYRGDPRVYSAALAAARGAIRQDPHAAQRVARHVGALARDRLSSFSRRPIEEEAHSLEMLAQEHIPLAAMTHYLEEAERVLMGQAGGPMVADAMGLTVSDAVSYLIRSRRFARTAAGNPHLPAEIEDTLDRLFIQLEPLRLRDLLNNGHELLETVDRPESQSRLRDLARYLNSIVGDESKTELEEEQQWLEDLLAYVPPAQTEELQEMVSRARFMVVHFRERLSAEPDEDVSFRESAQRTFLLRHVDPVARPQLSGIMTQAGYYTSPERLETALEALREFQAGGIREDLRRMYAVAEVASGAAPRLLPSKANQVSAEIADICNDMEARLGASRTRQRLGELEVFLDQVEASLAPQEGVPLGSALPGVGEFIRRGRIIGAAYMTSADRHSRPYLPDRYRNVDRFAVRFETTFLRALIAQGDEFARLGGEGNRRRLLYLTDFALPLIFGGGKTEIDEHASYIEAFTGRAPEEYDMAPEPLFALREQLSLARTAMPRLQEEGCISPIPLERRVELTSIWTMESPTADDYRNRFEAIGEALSEGDDEFAQRLFRAVSYRLHHDATYRGEFDAQLSEASASIRAAQEE